MSISKIAGVSQVTAQATEAIAKRESQPKPGVIVLEEQVIEGRIQKPEAFYILQRSNLNYDALEPKRSFVPRILDTVKKSPF